MHAACLLLLSPPPQELHNHSTIVLPPLPYNFNAWQTNIYTPAWNLGCKACVAMHFGLLATSGFQVTLPALKTQHRKNHSLSTLLILKHKGPHNQHWQQSTSHHQHKLPQLYVHHYMFCYIEKALCLCSMHSLSRKGQRNRCKVFCVPHQHTTTHNQRLTNSPRNITWR